MIPEGFPSLGWGAGAGPPFLSVFGTAEDDPVVAFVLDCATGSTGLAAALCPGAENRSRPAKAGPMRKWTVAELERSMRLSLKPGCYRALRLALVAQTLLVAVFFHPLTALVLCDFRFTSLFKGTHVKKLAGELRGGEANRKS
jgi:hypothetical protein